MRKETDQIISFKTAILAKEKGFDPKSIFYCGCYALEDFKYNHYDYNDDFNHVNFFKKGQLIEQLIYDQEKVVSVYTQTRIQRFLREEHKIDISIKATFDGYSFDVWDKKDEKTKDLLDESSDYNWSKEEKTYELALEKALQKGLSLIK